MNIKDLRTETSFAKDVREYVEGLRGHLLEISTPVIQDSEIVGYSCAVRFWVQGENERVEYAAKYAHFFCIEQVKTFVCELEKVSVHLRLKTTRNTRKDK